jgi:alpha-L-fucosidase
MKKSLLPCLLFLALVSKAQIYQPTWESLDSRPVPDWYKDGKFGIFIHWGVYAVPGWSTKGNYAEWYQYGLQTTDSARMKFHKAKFGNRTYYDLANDFKAELYNPDEWAKLFEQSGAKYIVLTSKHHDGFTLWPNQKANETWGFPWNAMDIGPKRDLLGDLFKAVKKTSVHAGMYYSLYEWFNPLWKKDKSRYALEHAWPQMKELINTYQPDVFWTDGDWEASDEVWKSKEFLSWLYNESPVKDRVVTVDRWGSNVRFQHGAVFTPEYQPDLDFEDHYWEESRGMGYSYGYNREEDAWDYNSAQSLILQLIDKVSRGGNFLLDIGPDEHGKIPPIMQERLLQIGDWMKINGEAIYHTQRWKVPSQWSEGRRDYKPKGGSGDLLLKLTIDPDPGYAVKEVFYTYNADSNSLYVIFPKYPGNKKLVLKNVVIPAETKINFLSTGANLPWEQENNNVVIALPEYDPARIKSSYAYVVKLEKFGNYMYKPRIIVEYPNHAMSPLISMLTKPGINIYYTVDGTEPTDRSQLYKKPFSIDKNSTVKAIVYQDRSHPVYATVIESAVTEQKVIKYEWMNSTRYDAIQKGISYKYYEPAASINMESSFLSPVVSSGIADTISVSKKKRKDKFALEFNGYFPVGKDEMYTFFIQSDDGSKLFIDGVEIVNNDGDHGTVEKSGKAALRRGYHHIRVLYFDSGGDNVLKVFWQPEGGKKQELSGAILYH